MHFGEFVVLLSREVYHSSPERSREVRLHAKSTMEQLMSVFGRGKSDDGLNIQIAGAPCSDRTTFGQIVRGFRREGHVVVEFG